MNISRELKSQGGDDDITLAGEKWRTLSEAIKNNEAGFCPLFIE